MIIMRTFVGGPPPYIRRQSFFYKFLCLICDHHANPLISSNVLNLLFSSPEKESHLRGLCFPSVTADLGHNYVRSINDELTIMKTGVDYD